MNSEKGQALPLAIIAFAIGSLVVAPFLSHAGTSLNSSRLYAEEIGCRSAADAGVEHAIWGLTKGTLAEQIPDAGDEITYQLDETLNGVNVTVTVTTDAVIPGGGILGDINNAVTDSYIYDNAYCNAPEIAHVYGYVYAIVYQGPGSDGFLVTLVINPDGTVPGTVLDTLEFDTTNCGTPDILQVSGGIFAIVYCGPNNDGFLKTVSIDAAGAIGDTVIDILEFDTSNGYEPDIISVGGGGYAIAYRGTGSDGFLKTVSIDAAGAIGDTVKDTLEFDTSNCAHPDIENIAGSVYAIAYQGPGSDGFLKTVTITSGGDIAADITDTLEFDISNCAYPDIIHISGDTYAITYQGTGNDGFLATMTVTATGEISASTIDTFEFDTVSGQEPRIIHIKDNVYAIAYAGAQNDGYIITLPVEADGTIPDTIIDTLEYDTSNGFSPSILLIAQGILAIAYCQPDARGFLATIGINTEAGSAAASYQIESAAGDINIRASVNIDAIAASIVSWSVE